MSRSISVLSIPQQVAPRNPAGKPSAAALKSTQVDITRRRPKDSMLTGRTPSGERHRAPKRCIIQVRQRVHSHTRLASGKYDMAALRELSNTEEAALEDLVQIYKVESVEKLPVSFDLHQLVDLKENERRAFIKSMLRACPSTDATQMSVDTFTDKYLERIKGIDARLTGAICVSGPTTMFTTECR